MKITFIWFAIVIPTMLGTVLNAQVESTESKTPMPSVVLVSAVDIEEEVDGQPARVSTVELTIRPKEAAMPHRHPGPVFGYVLKGVYEFKVEGKPLKTLKAGETFYEPLMALHEVGRNPSDSITKVLAIVTHPRSAKKLVIPEEVKE